MISLLVSFILFFAPDSLLSAVVESSVSIFSAGHSITRFGADDLLCIDRGTQSILLVDTRNAVQKTIGGRGWGDYEFDALADISSSFVLQVYATDRNNRRIQQFDRDLNFVQSFDEHTILQLNGRFQPIASAVSKFGDLFIIEGDGKRVLKMNTRGRIEREFGSFNDGSGALSDPIDIAIGERDEVCILDAGEVRVFDIFGNYIRTIVLPGSEWKNIQISGDRVIVTSPSGIFFASIEGTDRIFLPKHSIIGIPGDELLADAVVVGNLIVIITDKCLYRCSLR